MSSGSRGDIVGRLVGMLVCLIGVSLLVFVFMQAFRLFGRTPAEALGLQVVMNRCPKIEYGRISGEISWSGVNSRIISSKRPQMAPGFQRLTIG